MTQHHQYARDKAQRSDDANAVHEGNNYDAHRLPGSETAANEKKRGRLAGQAVKLIEDRLLEESKASAPFVKVPEF